MIFKAAILLLCAQLMSPEGASSAPGYPVMGQGPQPSGYSSESFPDIDAVAATPEATFVPPSTFAYPSYPSYPPAQFQSAAGNPNPWTQTNALSSNTLPSNALPSNALPNNVTAVNSPNGFNPFSLSAYAIPTPPPPQAVQDYLTTNQNPVPIPGEVVITSDIELESNAFEGPALETTLAPTATTYLRRWPVRDWLSRKVGQDRGLGYERVMYAPMTLDPAISTPNVGLRFRSERGLGRPDRLEYVWAKPGRGPAAESKLNIFDSALRLELGNARALLISEFTMRAVDPELNANTVGWGDMLLGGKTLLLDDRCFKLSTIFLTHLKTGPVDNGLGNGHVALEPGLLARFQASDITYFHGQVKYRLPIAGTPGFAGDVLNTGWAVSTIWRETDTYALLPTLELQTNTFLFGAQTTSTGAQERVDGTTAVDLFPGMRIAMARTALGVCECGIAGGIRCADSDWFDSRMMMEVRWLR